MVGEGFFSKYGSSTWKAITSMTGFETTTMHSRTRYTIQTQELSQIKIVEMMGFKLLLKKVVNSCGKQYKNI